MTASIEANAQHPTRGGTDMGNFSISSWPNPPKFKSNLDEREFLKFRLAQALRIFGNLGYDEGIAGHITVRDPIKPDCFWVNPFPSDLLLVDHDANIMDESGSVKRLNTAAFMIHSQIHRRPDVICAAHSHSVHGRAFSTLGRELDMITQDSCAFYDDHVVYREFNGIVSDVEEGKQIATALGCRKAAILQNHGLLVATDSVEATIFFFSSMEKCCRVQLLADAAAAGRGQETMKISPEEASKTWQKIGNLRVGWFSGLSEFDLLEATEGVRFDFGDKTESR